MKAIIITCLLLWLATVIGTSGNEPTPCHSKDWCAKVGK